MIDGNDASAKVRDQLRLASPEANLAYRSSPVWDAVNIDPNMHYALTIKPSLRILYVHYRSCAFVRA